MMETFLRFLCLTLLGTFLQYGNIASADSNPSVGSPKGKFDVSATGGAVYSIGIDAPKGLGNMQPNISLTYNSQSGNGIAGYGMNVAGISVITRGCKDIYHDGYAKGSKGLGDGAYYLDGRRLIKQNDIEGKEGAAYVLEGDPFTKVYFYGRYSDRSANVHIVVKTKDGLTYSYGSGSGSRLFYRQASRTRIQAWYIDKVEDVYGNTMSYSYILVGNCVYPAKITYGTNSHLSSSCTSTITFGYQNISNKNTQCVTLGGRVSYVDRRLSEITTATDGNVYRRYVCEYDSTLDASKIRYSHLVKVTEYNGKGDCLHPIVLDWKGLGGAERKVSVPQIDADYHGYFQEIVDKGFISVDFNGDGLSDIVKLAYVKDDINKYYDWQGVYHEECHPRTIAYFYQAKKDNTGKIAFDYVKQSKVDGVSDIHGLVSRPGGSNVLDFDGDGKADILVPMLNTDANSDQNSQFVIWRVFQGNSNLVMGKVSHLRATREMPLYTSLDINNDGKSEILYLEATSKDGKYLGGCLNFVNKQELANETLLSFVFPKDPKKIFSGDFNNDGMPDLLIVYDGGYKIYFNKGTDNLLTAFSEQSTISGTSFGSDVLMEQGDFNGDGLVDIIHCDNKGNAYFALNKGDGTFDVKNAAALDMVDKNTGKDDDKYEIIPYDMDGDGKTDLLALKSDYKYHGGFHNHYSFRNTKVAWLRSDGEKLVQEKVVYTNGETDAIGGNIIVGDFTGDGQISIMGYGKNIYDVNEADSVKMRLYTAANHSVSSGKVYQITDGFGNVREIDYASLTDSTVCLPAISPATFPVVDVRPDLIVVKQNQMQGIVTTYQYGGLKVHTQGLGLMGFERTLSKESFNGETVESVVEEWHPKYYAPQRVSVKTSVGDWKAESTTSNAFGEVQGTYFSYPKEQVTTDYDGNVVTSSAEYDISKGCPLSQTESYGSDKMFKKIEYKDYVYRQGNWLPTKIVSTQKHEDANDEYTDNCLLSYNPKGLLIQKIDHADTPLAVTITNDYDSLGHLTSYTQEGYGIPKITKFYEYDATGRFLTKEWQEPSAAVTTYTYDTWGNTLTSVDLTDAGHPLQTSCQYDGWGNLTKTISPLGNEENTKMTWGKAVSAKYCIEVSGTGKPTVKTWYDSFGRKTSCEYPLAKGAIYKEIFSYDKKGQVYAHVIQKGKLSVPELFSYDKRGRVVESRKPVTGKTVSYSYGNHSVTTTIGNKTYKKTTDAWGNIKTSSDPVSSVSYVYNSMGKPVEIECEGSKTLIEYDAVGNKSSITDPDAGTTTYEYTADGRLLKQTDARGIVTSNTYDELGRLTTSNIGGVEIKNTYGTSGNEKLQLVKTTCGDNSESYTYDEFGRLVSRKRCLEGDVSHQYTYSYNIDGSIASVVYPGGVSLGYVYDANGYLVSKKYNNAEFKSLTSYDGINTAYKLLGTLGSKAVTLNTNGHVKNVSFNCLSHKESFDYVYDSATDNLLSRTGVDSQKETFTYDGADRLTSVSCNGQRNLIIKYANDGNILNKLDVGNYEYGQKPHAVVNVENTRRIIPSATLSTEFNEFGKIDRIDDGNSLTSVDFVYGPDMQRWKSTTYNNGVVDKTVFYDTDYDKVIDKNGNVTEFIYLDDNLVMLRKNNGTSLPYIVTKDNLGSIISIYAGDGAQVFSASYDAWGKQTVTKNKLGFIRGYCGHEMLNEYQIINMNGRLYDPVLGRFLSPDDNIQSPNFSQNYNRYSYCLNNPLKYTDPSGEYFGLDDIIFMGFGGAINLTVNLFEGNVKNLWHGASLFALGGLAGECVLYGQPIASACLIGFGNSALNQGFANGFNHIDWTQVGISSTMSLCTYAFGSIISESMSGVVGQLTSKISNTILRNVVDEAINNSVSGFALGTTFALANGEKLGDALLSGLSDAGTGAVIGSVSGLQKGFVEKNNEQIQAVLKVKAETNNEAVSQADPNVLTQEMLNNPKMPIGEGTNTVYVGLDENGIVRYVGITNRDPIVRFNEHLNSNSQRNTLRYVSLDGTGNLSRIQARIIEQRLINAYGFQKMGGQLYNKINSIRPGESWFRYGIIGN